MSVVPQGVPLLDIDSSGCPLMPVSVQWVPRRERGGRECSLLLGLPQAPAFPPCLILTGLPLPEVPTGAHVLPRGGTNARRVARSLRKRSGASIFCSGAPSLGREEESQICPNLALPAWPPSSVWGGDGAADDSGLGSGALFPKAPARASLEVARCWGAPVVAEAWSVVS